jgi:hypothetical protein
MAVLDKSLRAMRREAQEHTKRRKPLLASGVLIGRLRASPDRRATSLGREVSAGHIVVFDASSVSA